MTSSLRTLLRVLTVLALQSLALQAGAVGQLDPGFGVGGGRSIGFDVAGDFDDRAISITALADGRLLLAGQVRTENERLGIGVTRLLANGSIDTSFGNAGRLVVRDAAGQFLQPYAAAVQSDGRIVVTGARYASLPVRSEQPVSGVISIEWFVLRIHANGSGIDPSFGANGMTLIVLPADYRQGQAIAVQTDDRIVVAGHRRDAASDAHMVAARLTVDGSIDTSFGGGDGIFDEEFATSYVDSRATAAVLQSDGRIVLAGWARKVGGDADYDMVVVRLNNIGGADATFGQLPEPGRAIVDFSIAGLPRDDRAFSLAFHRPFLFSPGRLIVGGASRQDGTSQLAAVAVLDLVGQLDTDFSSDGKFRFGNAFDSVKTGIYGIGLEKVGSGMVTADRILIGGILRDGAGDTCVAARLEFTGVFDPLFPPLTFRMSGTSNDTCQAAVAFDSRFFLAGATFPEMQPGGVDFSAFSLFAGNLIFRNGFE